MASPDNVGCQTPLTSSSAGFLLEHQAERYQRMFALYRHFGLQSNIIVAASYSHRDLSIGHVVRQYPQLGMIHFDRLSEEKKHQNEHLEFVDLSIEDEEARGLGSVIERYRGMWFEEASTDSKPPWKLIVINARHVLFVFDHYITDGRGAVAFHESLLDALNSIDEQPDSISSIVPVSIDQPLEDDPTERCTTRFSLLWTIYNAVRFHVLRFLYGGADLFFHDATYPKREFVYSKPSRDLHSPVTRLESLRLDATTMQKCLQACRKNNTSFTSLLHTLTKVGLAVDIYPNARFSWSQTAIDMRRELQTCRSSLEQSRAMTNASSAMWSFDRLGPFRQAGTVSELAAKGSDYPVDAGLVWTLAARHKADLAYDLSSGKTSAQGFQALKLIGEHQEDFASKLLPGLSLVSRNAFSVSNLGVFCPRPEGPSASPDARWKVCGMEFSGGAILGGVGPELVINAAGVLDGACVIHAAYQQGVLREDVVKTLMVGIEGRLKAMIE
ncbi:hypothetical protein P170DRAFT_454599 [Aspergillus steynii IBT 23096]|uniref:Alcohol acetyltransferase n=1 Tax=Aspergillus steynii IBT 23096 TaxID=1392250 RepID=A0A2I2GAH4_9EURO|nr:uncharacterized protein P170DRAFT_454599 [Aspergillus steynii IBT 23096]PLB49875.1 hypothetical protein P170DRAFT_454599 [Aspergillus steynii IBT 23096]